MRRRRWRRKRRRESSWALSVQSTFMWNQTTITGALHKDLFAFLCPFGLFLAPNPLSILFIWAKKFETEFVEKNNAQILYPTYFSIGITVLGVIKQKKTNPSILLNYKQISQLFFKHVIRYCFCLVKEQSPLALINTNRSSCFLSFQFFIRPLATGLQNWNKRPWGLVALTTRHLYPLKLALTSPTSGGRSVGIVRWRTKSPGILAY
jgi:hypothetical protein